MPHIRLTSRLRNQCACSKGLRGNGHAFASDGWLPPQTAPTGSAERMKSWQLLPHLLHEIHKKTVHSGFCDAVSARGVNCASDRAERRPVAPVDLELSLGRRQGARRDFGQHRRKQRWHPHGLPRKLEARNRRFSRGCLRSRTRRTKTRTSTPISIPATCTRNVAINERARAAAEVVALCSSFVGSLWNRSRTRS